MENKKTSFHKFMDATNPVKIELALVDDAKKIATDFAIVLKEIENNGIQFAKYAEAIERYGEEGLSLFQKAQNVSEKLESAYKQLGVEPTLNNDYKSLIRYMDTLLTYRKRYSF